MPPNDRSDENVKDSIRRQDQALETIQRQLLILTDLATRVAVAEERRETDRDTIRTLTSQIDSLKGKVETLHTNITGRFPIYDSLNEVYKTLNAKLWTAIITGVLGLVLAGGKYVLSLGHGGG